MTVAVQKVSDRWVALGLASYFVARHPPFSTFKAGDLIRTLSAQVHRGHCLFAFDKGAREARVLGYAGWALYQAAVAERFAATGIPPEAELAEGGDVIWMLVLAADDAAAMRALVREARALYPRHRLMGIRHKPNRRVIFDRRAEAP